LALNAGKPGNAGLFLVFRFLPAVMVGLDPTIHMPRHALRSRPESSVKAEDDDVERG